MITSRGIEIEQQPISVDKLRILLKEKRGKEKKNKKNCFHHRPHRTQSQISGVIAIDLSESRGTTVFDMQ